jgi:hypothetical protein
VYRRYIVTTEDVPKGAYIPVDGNPNIMSQVQCNTCGVTISEADAYAAATLHRFFVQGAHSRDWNGDICPPCKSSLTITELERRITEGTAH